MSNTTLKFYRTRYGLPIAQFQDRHGEVCSIQKASTTEEGLICLGPEGHLAREDDAFMYMTQAMVVALLPSLQYFAATGVLPGPEVTHDDGFVFSTLDPRIPVGDWSGP